MKTPEYGDPDPVQSARQVVIDAKSVFKLEYLSKDLDEATKGLIKTIEVLCAFIEEL